MRMDELDYVLPPERIATLPAEPRDASRLMVVHADSSVEHRHFFDLIEYLRAGDLVVVNNTRVLPAKLLFRRRSGAAIPGLFVRELAQGLWEVMLRTRGKVKEGEILESGAVEIVLQRRAGDGLWHVQLQGPAVVQQASEVLSRIGHVPLPPYIEKQRRASGGEEELAADRAWYQTVYAHQTGGRSVAAPTAGLHFTPGLLTRLEAMGVRRVSVELEVGMGTFLPVETETLEEHRMHVERYRVPAETIRAIRQVRAGGGRIVVVGTTAVRTLETCALQILPETPAADVEGETGLKIAPGFKFQLTDVLITNFHLPRSTLMALVGAFLGGDGVARLKALYAEAIEKAYRFYSYGDAMVIMNRI